MTLSWDLFVLLFASVVTVYAILMGRNRIVGMIVNFYVSLAVTLVAGEVLYNFASNLSFISSRFAVTEFSVNTIFLVFLTVLLTVKSEIAGLDSGGSISKLQAGIYGFLASGLVLSTIFNFMSQSERVTLDSNFVNLISGYHIIWVLAPITVIIGSSFIKRS